MTGSSRPLIAGFFAALVLTLASFVVASVVVRNRARRIGVAADSIVRNGAPSLQRLSAMRSTLRRLEVNLDDATDRLASRGATSMPPSASLDRLALQTDWNVYRELPTYPRESLQRGKVGAALERTQGAVEALDGAFQRQAGEEAAGILNARVKPTFEQLDQALDQAIRINADTSNELAESITQARENVNWLATVLDGVSVGLSLLAGSFAIRLARGYVRAQEARMEELDLFAARVAHDIRSPLAAAAMGLDLALRAQVPASRGESLLQRVRGSLRRVDQLVEGLLAFARSAQVTRGDDACDVLRALGQVVEELRPVAEGHGITLMLSPQEGGGTVECSEAMLNNVVANLVHNAIKYMGDAPVREVALRVSQASARIRVEVQDTGPGIPAALQSTLFQPYTRAGDTAVPGLGLGLATVQRVTRALGGEVGVTSREGEGSLFWLDLPLARAPAAAALSASLSGGS